MSARGPLLFFYALIFSASVTCAQGSPSLWNAPKPVDEHTVFFGEDERTEPVDSSQPAIDDKSYPWVWMQRGNNYLLEKQPEKAAVSFAKAYSVGGPVRVLSGFKLVETLEQLGRLDEALVVLEEMQKKYLASNQELGQARSVLERLQDQKRKQAQAPPAPAFTGRAWLLKLSTQRMKYALDAMETLRSHGILLKESAQKYVFRLDEYFIAHPEQAAGDGPAVLAGILYEIDPETRLPIDQWRLDPGSTLVPEKKTVSSGENKFTGAEWITLIHERKMTYVTEAMDVLRNQQVPMSRSAYAYEYSLDELFTEKPELDASDSVVALASILKDTEPEAREILEALRLK